MRFAIISDIHGNLPALDAVLEDAKRNQVESYIFVGDYCLSNPYPNECILRMRGLHNKNVVRGNEEKYLENLIGKDQDKWTDGQMARCKYRIIATGRLVRIILIIYCRCPTDLILDATVWICI